MHISPGNITPPDFPKLPGLPDFDPIPQIEPHTQNINLTETRNAISALSETSEFDGPARSAILDLYKSALSDNTAFEIDQEYDAVRNARQNLEFMARTPEMDKIYQALTEVEGVLHELKFGFSPDMGPDILPDFPPMPMPNVTPNFEFLADTEK